MVVTVGTNTKPSALSTRSAHFLKNILFFDEQLCYNKAIAENPFFAIPYTGEPMGQFIYQKSIPTDLTADVLVIGGGPAGLCAAIAAARTPCSSNRTATAAEWPPQAWWPLL